MDVMVLAPIHEEYRDCRPGEVVCIPEPRAYRLAALGLVALQGDAPQIPAPPSTAGEGTPDAWSTLRAFVGANRPRTPTFRTRRSRLDELRPGEKFLILLRYAGIGDHLNASMLFPALREQYPEIRVAYALPQRFHPLFEGTGVQVVSHDGPVESSWFHEYDLVEDINRPCHVWENFFVRYGGTTGDGNGLRWRNRLDIMSRWFGLTVRHPHSEIAIREEEKAEARRLMAANGRPTCIVAPISFSQARSYPWFAELAERLISDGWDVRFLHSARLPGPVETLAGLSLRMMGAVCSLADLIVSMDTAAFHWGGILGRPTVAVFNSQLGVNHCRDYPTARPVQTCATPCIHNVRWGGDNESCPNLTREALPDSPGSGPLSRCFSRETVEQIMASIRAFAGQPKRGN